MSTREKFVERFGEADAARIEAAAETHLAGNSVHADDNRGDDPFQYVLLAAIGWDCVTLFTKEHGIEADPDEIKQWVFEHGNLAQFAGDPPDYLALMAGAYEGWVNMEEIDD